MEEVKRINGIRVVHYNPGPREKLAFWATTLKVRKALEKEQAKRKAMSKEKAEKLAQEFIAKFGPKTNEEI